jgi:hypothetical protein
MCLSKCHIPFNIFIKIRKTLNIGTLWGLLSIKKRFVLSNSGFVLGKVARDRTKKGGLFGRLLRFYPKIDYLSNFGASTGQTLAHVPHSVHFSGSIT